MTESLPIDGRSLTLEQFLAVVRGGCAVSLTSEARDRVESSRRAVERAVQSGRAVYGVTTGFGALSDRPIPHEQVRALQRASCEVTRAARDARSTRRRCAG